MVDILDEFSLTSFKMNNKLLYFIDDNSKQEKVLTAINLQSIVNS